MSRRVNVNGHCTNKYDIIKVGNRTNNIIGSDDISNENNDNIIIIRIKILIKLIALLMYITCSMITHNDVTRKHVIQKRSYSKASIIRTSTNRTVDYPNQCRLIN